MASSPVELANSALLKVGANTINSFDDNKAEAEVISVFYERAYRFLLSTHYWGFAMTTRKLAQVEIAPEAEYTHAYALPDDFIRIQRTFPNSNYKIVGKQLHTNLTEIAVKYTFRAAEEDLPIYFENAFMYLLAEQITVPLTENQSKSDSNFAKYKDMSKIGKSLDAQQYPQDGFQDFPVESSRYGGGLSGLGRY